MESPVSPMDNPLTLPIRRGQTLLESSGHEVLKADSEENLIALLPEATEEAEPAQTAEAPAEIPPDVDPGICPRCGGKLVNPQELGWCPKCSYCRSLEKDKTAAKLVTEALPKKSTLAQFGEYGEMISKIPMWGWMGAGVAIVIVALAVVANTFLPEEDSLARALISLITIVLTVVTVLCLNLWSVLALAADDEHMGPKDIFFPFKLWGKICRKLPQMRYQFLTIIWCLTGFVCAIFIVAGLEYWWELYKPKRVAKNELLSAVTALADGAKANDRTLTESIEDFASKQNLKAKAEAEKKKAKPKVAKQTTQSVVVGYTTTDEGELDGLVVAILLKDRIRFAGIVRKGFSPKDKVELLNMLKPMVQPKSYIPGLAVSAIWVKPAVFCEVTHEDFDVSQHFNAPEFKGLLADTR